MTTISASPVLPACHHSSAWRVRFSLLLAISLVFAQMLWSAHQIQHLIQHDRGVCSTCVGLTGVSTPATPSTPTVVPPTPGSFTYTLGQRLAARATSPSHHPRAPPTTISTVV